MKISYDDRGPGKIEIRSFGPSDAKPKGFCVIQFPPDTNWVGLPPAELEALIQALQGHLRTLKGETQ